MLVESTERPCGVEATKNHLPAPWQHTALLAVVLGLWAIYGALRAGLAASELPLPVRYISSIVLQWLIVGSTIAGLYNRRDFVLGVLGLPTRNRAWKDLAVSVSILASGWLVVILVHIALKHTRLRITYPNNAITSLLPHTSLEMALWVFVAMTAGFCEEFVFRGYLQRQISEWSGSVPVGIVVPSLIFGCLHLYQGVGSAIGITCLGLIYAVFAARLGNLRSVMIAHALQDLLAGLIYHLRHS